MDSLMDAFAVPLVDAMMSVNARFLNWVILDPPQVASHCVRLLH